MSFQTELTPMDIEVFESVLYNAQKEISKIKLTLQFDDEQKYKRFMNRFSPLSNQDDDVLSNSDEDEQGVDGQQLNDELGISHQVSLPEEIVYVEKLARLQMSIILKENYKEKIQNIIDKTGVKILIVPEKLKFFGFSEESIQEAKSLVHEIRLNIIISSLQKFGKQAYQSQFLKQKLSKCGIKLGRVSQKYYYWYDQSQSSQTQIKQSLSQIFNKSTHIFYPLLQNYQILRRKYNEKYINSIIKANAQLYTKYLDNQINEQKKYYTHAQLNDSKTQVIIHVPVRQQSEKIAFQIRKFFLEAVHFFVRFKNEENGEISKIKDIQNKLTEKGIWWTRYEDLIVITFSMKNGNQKGNQTFLNVTNFMENKCKEFVQSLRPVFELNCNCCIQLLRDIDGEQLDQTEQKNQALYKRISIQSKRQDGIVVISSKLQQVNTYLSIIEQLVLKPKILSQKNQKKSHQASSLNNQHPQINQSSLLGDTTTLIQNSALQQNPNEVSQFLGANGELIENNKNSNNNSILGELKYNAAFGNYVFYFRDRNGNKKYQDVEEIKRGKAMRCEDLETYEELLENVTKRKFQIYDVCLPQKLNPNFKQTDNLVTVFVKDSDKQSLTQPFANVYLFADSKIFSNNGWVINIDKAEIKENNYKYEIPTDKMEIVNYIKYIEG